MADSAKLLEDSERLERGGGATAAASAPTEALDQPETLMRMGLVRPVICFFGGQLQTPGQPQGALRPTSP